MQLFEIIDHIYPISDDGKALLQKNMEEVSHPKGTLLMKPGRVEHYLYFIKKGMVRAFAPLENEEVTFWFGEEGSPVLSMNSYVNGQKGYEYIELLEDSELYRISLFKLQLLYQVEISLANFGRKLAELELLKLEQRMVVTELLSAKQRYEYFMSNHSSWLLRVPLKYIASYLGMTQVSLSRVRKLF